MRYIFALVLMLVMLPVASACPPALLAQYNALMATVPASYGYVPAQEALGYTAMPAYAAPLPVAPVSYGATYGAVGVVGYGTTLATVAPVVRFNRFGVFNRRFGGVAIAAPFVDVRVRRGVFGFGRRTVIRTFP